MFELYHLDEEIFKGTAGKLQEWGWKLGQLGALPLYPLLEELDLDLDMELEDMHMDH